MLSQLDGPAYLERVAVNNVKNVRSAKRAIKKAFENQVNGLGFSLVEVVSTCPTNWGMTPEKALEWVDRKNDTLLSPRRVQGQNGKGGGVMSTTQILIAGFGGQGVLFAGKFLAYKGLCEGRQVSWLPSYGPEMRGGTANCSVTLSDDP